MKKTDLISSKVVRIFKAGIVISLVIGYFIYKKIDYTYDIIFLLVFVYLIIKYFTIED